MFTNDRLSWLWATGIALLLCAVFTNPCGAAKTHHRTFIVQEAPYTRLCNTKNILTVNGSFPGPTIYARNGDTVYVKVINAGNKNITIHWHGVRQPRDPWSDGPEYITQCPIQPGHCYTQRIQLTEEEGTVWWHAHTDFDRATVHGAIVVHPRSGAAFPFPEPKKEFVIMLGEWWNRDVTEVYETAVANGGEFQPSDANTINGQPGDFLPCSAAETFKVPVEQGNLYLLRVINAAISTEFFFTVAGHKVTVVGTDGSYTKLYTNDYIIISPGQTMDLLLQTDQFKDPLCPYRYYILASPYFDGSANVSRDPTVASAVLQYETYGYRYATETVPVSTSLPSFDDVLAAYAFASGLRSLARYDHPVNVPQTVDVRMYVTISVNEQFCPYASCAGPNGNRLAASMNNASFQTPNLDILDAYYMSISGVFATDFPDLPPLFFNFTDANIPQQLYFVDKSTRVKVLEYDQNVELVFQGTNILGGETHPIHLHGQSFYVVGSGFGNFDYRRDPYSYNLVDPPYRNTVGVPRNGWTAIRFKADNPGVWFMHCHLDRHMTWGMDAVFITKNGYTEDAQMFPPPGDRPPC